jgi:hypothetical protein
MAAVRGQLLQGGMLRAEIKNLLPAPAQAPF